MSVLAEQFKAKIRGILGLGLIGGFVGFVGGALWGLVSTMLRSGIFFDADYLPFLGRMALGNGIGFMKIGAFTMAGFAVLLAAVESRRSITELPLWRMGIFGALVGALFPPIYVISRMGLPVYLESAQTFLPVMGILGGVGGVTTAAIVWIAKSADRKELRSAEMPGVFSDSE